eukprot:scaffold184_cov106-Isochrysis_galbana.AAC.2
MRRQVCGAGARATISLSWHSPGGKWDDSGTATPPSHGNLPGCRGGPLQRWCRETAAAIAGRGGVPDASNERAWSATAAV